MTIEFKRESIEQIIKQLHIVNRHIKDCSYSLDDYDTLTFIIKNLEKERDEIKQCCE